ncbi:MAG: hypothetical protein JO129_01730 [Candidatus Dependentiae bacterium]|nr:hypothetical protein [Candidatus Dependentiae bacterium]
MRRFILLLFLMNPTNLVVASCWRMDIKDDVYSPILDYYPASYGSIISPKKMVEKEDLDRNSEQLERFATRIEKILPSINVLPIEERIERKQNLLHCYMYVFLSTDEDANKIKCLSDRLDHVSKRSIFSCCFSEKFKQERILNRKLQMCFDELNNRRDRTQEKIDELQREITGVYFMSNFVNKNREAQPIPIKLNQETDSDSDYER